MSGAIRGMLQSVGSPIGNISPSVRSMFESVGKQLQKIPVLGPRLGGGSFAAASVFVGGLVLFAIFKWVIYPMVM